MNLSENSPGPENNGAIPPPIPGMPPSLEGVKRSKRLPTQTILLALVLAVSASALLAMRQYGMRSGMTFEPLLVDYKPEDAEKARTYERIMADLARVQQPLDVALGEFKASPFMFQSAAPVVVNGEVTMPVDDGSRAAAEARLKAEEKRALTMSKLASLRLQSVFDGRKPIARINDEVVSVGDRVGKGEFLVTEIKGRSVTLSFENETFVLEMAEKERKPQFAPARIGR